MSSNVIGAFRPVSVVAGAPFWRARQSTWVVMLRPVMIATVGPVTGIKPARMAATETARSAADMAGTAVAGMPARRAAQAMPSAWLPVEAVTTPRGFPAIVTAASAPRTLNDPVGW